jgi:hypothetical protein
MSLEELRKDLVNPDLEERFFGAVERRFNLQDRTSITVIRFLIDHIVVKQMPNDWCVLKTLYARTKVRISLNEFYYSVIPNLITIGLLEMKMSISPSGKYKRVVRLCESFVVRILYPMMKNIKR